MLALLFQFLSVFIFLLMAEFYCDQMLQFSSIYFAAEWITKSAFKALHGAQRSGESGLSTLVAEFCCKKALAVRYTWGGSPVLNYMCLLKCYVNINRLYLSVHICPNSWKALFWCVSNAAPVKTNFPIHEETLNNKYFSTIRAKFFNTCEFLIV